jgi:hypothetical protein
MHDWTHHGHGSGLERVAKSLDAEYVFVLWPGGRGTHVELA